MLNKEQSDNLLFSLSSFFRDFLPLDNNLLKLYNIYASTIDYGWNVYREAEDGQYVSTARTLSTIPYFKVDISDGIYDLNTARILSRLSLEEQIAYLDKEHKYASFIFSQKDAAGEPVVYGMRLFTQFDDVEPLRLYEEYFLRSNRLYLLPQFIQNRKKFSQYLHAFDIKYNENTLEKNFGTFYSLKAGPLLPRYEYRDALEAFIRSFQGNLTIKAIKDSVLLATKWESFKLEDYKSPFISQRKLQLYKDWVISPFTFLLSLPESLIPDKVKVNIAKALLNEIKEAHTNYMVFFEIERNDPYSPPMQRIPTIRYNRGDESIFEDETALALVKVEVIEDPMEIFARYDSRYFYNDNFQFDEPPTNDEVTIKHYTLMIPRNFKTTKNQSTGDITFSCNANTDTTTHFELYGSPTKNGTYELIETVPNTGSGTISFIHNAKGSGKLYYKSRTKDPDKTSLFTLPVDINSL